MQRVMRALNVDNGSSLTAKLIEVGAIDQKEWRKVAKWVRGENAPDHYATMSILRAAGMLAATDANSPRLDVEQARRSAVRLADEAAELARLLQALPLAPRAGGGSQ